MKKNLKFFLVFLFFSIFAKVFIFGQTSFVFAASPGCNVEEVVYKPGLHLWEINLQRTIWNTANGVSVAANTQVSGLSPNEVMKCQTYAMKKLIELGEDGSNIPQTCTLTQTEEDAVEDMCAAYSSDISVVDTDRDPEGEGKSDSVLVDSVNSSLLGIGTMLEGVAHKEPLPVNFAYYWNKEVSKVPFVGRALAANDSEAYSNLPVLKAVYDIWKISLSVSLALLSLVLLYTGIMITMGKKISTQLVVNVQYAIPKIVIGAILIIFSYPIGAAITSVSFGLYRGADDIFFSLVKGAGVAVPPSGLIFTIISTTIFALVGGGASILIFALIFLLVLLIVKLILYIKVIMIYAKMAVSVVTAPFEFVLGTVPGNDDKIKDWFLRMAKYGITLFGMGIVIPATMWVALKIMLAYQPGGSSEVGGWGVAISVLAPFMIILFGYGMGINMEKRVDEMFFGKKKR